MKDYKTIVNDRYDQQQYDSKAVLNNIYSPINPVGFYGEFKAAQILSDFIKMIDFDIEVGAPCLLDCGCGDGSKTRIMSELLGNPHSVYGMEYSENRLSRCKMMNPAIHYEYGDLTKEIPFPMEFDGITTFVVFMHFSKEEEIVNALKNIYNSLKKNGLFLWYECNEKSHWDGRTKDVDGWGFSTDEMDRYAAEAGFRLVKGYGIYPRFPVLNTSSIYLAERVKKIWMLEWMEKLPFRKNNSIRIYRK